jgi:hypothetical protein
MESKYYERHSETITIPPAHVVGGDGLVVPSWLALCWIAQGSGFESQRGHLFFGIPSRGEISQEGFVQGLVSPPCHRSTYRVNEDNFRGSVCVSEWMLYLLKKNLRLHKDNK